METAGSSKTGVPIYQSTWHHTPTACNHDTHCHQNLTVCFNHLLTSGCTKDSKFSWSCFCQKLLYSLFSKHQSFCILWY